MSHLIRPGDTLSALAARYRTSVSALMGANPQITNADVIAAGATLQIPGKSDSFTASASAAATATPKVAAPTMDLQFDGGASFNPNVVDLQRALVAVGAMKQSDMDTGPGHYGPKTRAAVNKLQVQAGIMGDGGEHYGPRTRAALQSALAKTSSATSSAAKAAPAAPTGSLAARDAQTAKKIDAVLAGYPGSQMQGMGTVIVATCRKEHVPVDLLMAQLAKESTFLRTGNNLSIANNNPGNLRHAGWESQFGGTPGVGGFERFPSIARGIQAYAHLMGSPSLPYRALVDAKNWKALVHLYAPSSDGNDEVEYVRELTEWKAMFAAKIGVSSNWVNEK